MARSGHLLLAWALLLSRAGAAQPPGLVLWLEPGTADADPVERALRLELGARGMLLLSSGRPAPAADAADDVGPARTALEGTSADAVLWLRADPAQQVTWLRVLRRGEPQAEQAPLAHTSGPLDAQLVAVAAASLLDQVLSAHTTAQPAPPTPQAAAQSAQVPMAPAAAHADAAHADAALLDPTPPALRAGPRPSAVIHADLARAPHARKPWFVQLGAALALGHFTSGMEADQPPPDDEGFTDNGLFDDGSAWVPDSDSRDRLGRPAGNCPADGVATGPGETPTKWCVRAFEPGFVFMPAVRLAAGYWLMPDVALSVLYQWHLGVRSDSLLDSHLFGLQGELLLLHDRARTSSLSLLAGGSVGRTDTTATPPGQTGERSPDARSGPFGLHGGLRVRLAFNERLTLFASPTLGGRFPASQLTAELDVGLEL